MGWTTAELTQFLSSKAVPASAYSFYKERDDAICLDRVGNEWLVYYSERGTRRDLAWARNEAQALDVLKLFVLEANGLL